MVANRPWADSVSNDCFFGRRKSKRTTYDAGDILVEHAPLPVRKKLMPWANTSDSTGILAKN